MARIDWATAARGGRVFPLLLIHGLGVVIAPAGAFDTVSSVALTDPDPLFFPGTDGPLIGSLLCQWLHMGQGFTWSERATATDAQQLDIAALQVRLDDVDGAVTRLLSSQTLALATYLTQEASATATTLHVVSTTGFGSSGVVYLGRESVAYTGKTSTTFTGCTRGMYGSEAVRHPFSESAGEGLGNTQVADRPTELVGRLATLWSVEVIGGALTNLSLEYVGHVGGGDLLGGAEDGWTLQIDHVSKALDQNPRTATVTIGGYAHPGNHGARDGFDVDGTTVFGRIVRGGLTPVADAYGEAASPDVAGIVILTGDAAAPDNGGWHATREEFVGALNLAAQATLPAGGNSFVYTLTPEGKLSLEWQWEAGSGRGVSTFWGFEYGAAAGYPIAESGARTSSLPMPEAWVPIVGDASRVYLSDADYASIPAAISLTSSEDNTRAFWALVWEDEGGEGARDTIRRAVRISGTSSSGGVNYVIAQPVLGAEAIWRNNYLSSLRGRTGLLVTRPTTARVALYVQSDFWVSALRHAVTVVAEDLGDSASQAFDWDRIAAVARQYASPIAATREYLIDGDASVLGIFANECALQGFVPVPYRGRIAIARIADFAPTETHAGDLTERQLERGEPRPAYSRARDGIVNTLKVSLPESNTTFNFVDRASLKAFGARRDAIEVTLPAGLFPRSIDGAQYTTSIAAMAMSVLGPIAYPYEQVQLAAVIACRDYQVGDLLRVSLWGVPNGRGGRGLIARTAQVVERAPELFTDGERGLVRFTVRLNPENLSGWAPSAFAAAGGIFGAGVELDLTIFGAAGCAQSGTDGGASIFAAGHKVRLVEVDNPSPTAATQHEVTSVAGPIVYLSPAPSATFALLAADPLKVLLMFDDWDVVVPEQRPWAFLASAGYVLDASGTLTAARVYAS